MSRIPLDAIKDGAREQIETLAPKLLPHGQRRGNWWVARCPWRDDKKPSLHLSLTTTYYRDYGTSDSGTILDLVMKLDGCSLAAAAETLAGLLGLTEATPRPKRPEPPRCRTCAHAWDRFDGARRDRYYCTAVTCFMTGEPQPIVLARRSGWACGPRARLHTQRAAGGQPCA